MTKKSSGRTKVYICAQNSDGGDNFNVDVAAMMKYHDKYIYPTDYQLLRIVNLAMILSGTLFEMLKIYNPIKAIQSQADFSSVDEKEDEIFSNDKTTANKNKKGKKTKGKKQNKKESKKQK